MQFILHQIWIIQLVEISMKIVSILELVQGDMSDFSIIIGWSCLQRPSDRRRNGENWQADIEIESQQEVRNWKFDQVLDNYLLKLLNVGPAKIIENLLQLKFLLEEIWSVIILGRDCSAT